MRREGRPHGMVRTYHVLPAPLSPTSPTSRILNKIDAPPTAGIFTKVSKKPTNHSKFTGKCEKVRCSGCHLHPSWKSKDKSKGAQKLKSYDGDVNYQQITWNVVGLNKMRSYGCYSASGLLDQLSDHYHDQEYDDHDHEHGHEYDGRGHVDQGKSETLVESSYHDHGNVKVNDDDEIVIHVGVTDDGDDGYKGFYDVGYVMNLVDEDEEGWSIVG